MLTSMMRHLADPIRIERKQGKRPDWLQQFRKAQGKEITDEPDPGPRDDEVTTGWDPTTGMAWRTHDVGDNTAAKHC